EVIIDPAARAAGDSSAPAEVETAAADDAPASDPAPAPDEGAFTELPPIESAIEQLEPAEPGPLADTPSTAEAEAQGARNALAAVRFDDLRITAPQRVLLSMSIASLEASLDLTLAGTAAQPRLSGEARALRGS